MNPSMHTHTRLLFTDLSTVASASAILGCHSEIECTEAQNEQNGLVQEH